MASKTARPHAPHTVPALVEALFLPGFDYSVRGIGAYEGTDSSASPSNPSFLIEGLREFSSDSASAPTEQRLTARFQVLSSYPRVVFLAQPAGVQRHILMAAGMDSLSALIPRAEDVLKDVVDTLFVGNARPILWNEQHMPYTTAFLDGCELRIHVYTTTLSDGRILCEHEQIWASMRVTAATPPLWCVDVYP